MLTDKDKIDIYKLIVRMSGASHRSDLSRVELVTGTVKSTLGFITAHPDMCAAELDEYLMDTGNVIKEFRRLDRNGFGTWNHLND